MQGLIPLRFFPGIIVVVCLVLAGCSTPQGVGSPPKPQAPPVTRLWKPYLPYLLPSPHPRLYVEIDAVKNCEPTDATLNKLRSFLTAYCNKPGGVEIVRSDVIPTAAAQGVSRRSLACKFLNGPPEGVAGAPPAFMYILFYDGALCPTERKKNPHVDFFPYPATAYMNKRYRSTLTTDELVLHEAGHLLGLAIRPAYASNNHCVDTNCRMNYAIRYHIGRFLTFRDPITQRQLCDRCVAQLTENSKLPPANVRFMGPVLVRSEAGYHVLSLPLHVKVVVGDLTEQDCKDFANEVRAKASPQGMENPLRCDVLIKEEVANEPEMMQEILKRAKADPFETVRFTASLPESTGARP